MIASAPKPRRNKSVQHTKFLTMLPTIASYAAFAFRQLGPEAKEDAVTEVIAFAFVAYSRLAELGKTSIAYPTVLALYGIRRYWDGRRVGTKANRNDAYSNGSQRQRLGTPRDQRWQEALVDNTKSPVPDQVAFRIDFGEWLRTLNKRNRDIVFKLCQGDRPIELARKHNISRGRVSQLRRELHDNWQAFQGEAGVADATVRDAPRRKPVPPDRTDRKPVPPRGTATDDALKEELLREAVAWEAELRAAVPSQEERNLADMLIDSASGPVDWSRLRDDTPEKLAALIEAKLEGREVHAATEEPVQVLKLLDALKQSVARAAGGNVSRKARGRKQRTA